MYAVKYPAESKKELQKRNSIPPLVKKLYDEQGRAEWSPKNSDTPSPAVYNPAKMMMVQRVTPRHNLLSLYRSEKEKNKEDCSC
jgi:hypothetical protein